MKRAFPLAMIAALGAAAGGIGLTRCGGGGSAGDDARTVAHGRGTDGDAGPSGAEALAWLGEPDRAPRRIAGRVFDGDRPAAGAIVRIADLRTQAAAIAEPVIVTGADGRFDFGEVPIGQLMVVAEAPGRLGDAAHVDLRDPTARPAPDGLELRLAPCTWAIFGAIEDASGGVVARARIESGWGPRAQADDAGAYELCVRPGWSGITVSADGYGTAELRTSIWGRQRFDVKLLPEATVSGTVVTDSDGRAIEGALVTVAREGESGQAAERHAVSDARGAFLVTGITPGRVRVTAMAEGLSSVGGEQLALQAGDARSDLELRLTGTYSISGVVVSGGEPVSGATVKATAAEQQERGDAISDDAGRFTVRGLPAGEVILDVEDWELPRSLSVTVANADLAGVRIEVEPMASIAGRVTARGQPVADCQVWAKLGQRRISSARTLDDGSYLLTGVREGSLTVQAESLEAGAYTRGRDLTIAKREKKTGVDLELDLAASVSGIVVEEDGTPVAGVHVRLTLLEARDWGFATTGADGTWTAGALSGGGDYMVEVKPSAQSDASLPPADGGAFPTIHVTDGTAHVKGVRLVVKLGKQSIAGRVVGPSGKAAPDVRVRAAEVGDARAFFGWWMDLPSATTDANGDFAIAGLLPGSYAVEARSPTGATKVESPIAAGTAGVVIQLPEVGRIEGDLVGFAPGVRVSAQAMGHAHGMEAIDARVTGASFEISGLPPGRYLVSARAGAAADSEMVTVESGAAATVTLESRGEARLEAILVDLRGGGPVGEGSCSWSPLAEGPARMVRGVEPAVRRIGADGKVSLQVAAGRGLLRCHGRELGYHEMRELELEPGETRTLRIKVVVQGGERVETGIYCDPMTSPPTVSMVVDPAAAAGVEEGDVLLAVDGVDVRDVPGMTAMMLLASHDLSAIRLRLARAGAELEVTITPIASED